VQYFQCTDLEWGIVKALGPWSIEKAIKQPIALAFCGKYFSGAQRYLRWHIH
jgi:hypothetical protein